jgi:3-oxoacyl-[acyl-carrier protein] reductase
VTLQKSVLITGGASGIGLACARAFAAQGCQILLADVSPSVHEVAGSLSTATSPVKGVVVDLAVEQQVIDLAATALQLMGGCDVLVNSAGIAPKRDGKPIAPTDLRTHEWELVMRVNLTAPFLLSRELIPAMQRRKFGRIVNIASRAGRTFSRGAGADYAASKAGLIGLTRHLAGCYAADGITVNAIAPGRVQTALTGLSNAQVLAQSLQEIPVGRFGSADEIAATVLFLASDGAAYMTGACLDVNGGGFMA